MAPVQYLPLLLLLQIPVARSEDNCSIIYDDNRNCLMKEMLMMIDHGGNQLAVDKKKSILYFGLDRGSGRFSPAMLNLETMKLTLLDAVKDGLAAAVDDGTGNVYFGGSTGIYKFTGLDAKVQSLNLNQTVHWIVLRSYIYFIKKENYRAYVYSHSHVKSVRQLHNIIMNQFVFDASRNIYFINGTGLYRISKYHYMVKPIEISRHFLCMTTNNYGQVFMSTDDGIYYVKGGGKMKKYADIPGVLAMTFDKNNHLIYSNNRHLIRLLPMSHVNVAEQSKVENVILVK